MEQEHYVALKSNSIKIEVENYYAVDYIDRFYIGRILQGEKPQFWNMKFLHQHSDKGKTIFKWPERPDINKVYQNNIFWGPINLKGCL